MDIQRSLLISKSPISNRFPDPKRAYTVHLISLLATRFSAKHGLLLSKLYCTKRERVRTDPNNIFIIKVENHKYRYNTMEV